MQAPPLYFFSCADRGVRPGLPSMGHFDAIPQCYPRRATMFRCSPRLSPECRLTFHACALEKGANRRPAPETPTPNRFERYWLLLRRIQLLLERFQTIFYRRTARERRKFVVECLAALLVGRIQPCVGAGIR